MADSEPVNATSDNVNTFSSADGWSDDTEKKVSGNIELKYKIVDGKNDIPGPLYYVVSLQEKIRHLFMPGWFEAMDAPVRAVVLLKPHYKGLIEPMQQLERTKVVDNWEYANKYKGTTGAYAGKWNHYMAGTTSDSTGIDYKRGNAYRTESINVEPTSRSRDGGQPTAANGGKFYSEKEVDSLNIDFQAEIKKKFSTDWDLGQPLSGQNYAHVEGGNSWGKGNGDDKRILFNVEFNEAFAIREGIKEVDPLWVRIESDPIKKPYADANVGNFNSVRQITLNFNSDNTAINDDDETNKYYEKRPYVIFYTGPENIDYTTDENGVLIRHSQPVVINLNKDTNAIMYMPESPVIINGNEHTLRGFVIAKCFLKTVTSEDMTGDKSFQVYDGFNAERTFEAGYSKFNDSYGNEIYIKPTDALTKADIDTTYEDTPYDDFTVTTDDNIISVYVKPVVPEYPILTFTKDLYTNCTTLAEYFNVTANYINSTYTKEKYMSFSGLSESEVSMITFPEENEVLRNASGIIPNPNTAGLNYGNFTDITIPVATAALLPSDPDPDVLTKDDKYVKVMLGTEEKYIAKSKLPHFRVKWNANYPYVCIYDLKTGLGWGMESPFICVKPMDNTTNTNDSAIVFTNSKNQNVAGANQWGDVWVIERRLLEDIYNKQYIANKLEFSEREGTQYFRLKSDITTSEKTEPKLLAKYRKVTDSYGQVKYVKEGDKLYYTKVYNNDSNHENYIIVDENGNMLTKPVTAPEIFGKTTQTENHDLIEQVETNGSQTLKDYWKNYTRDPKDPAEIPNDYKENIVNGKYRGNDTAHLNDDYRVPAFERVYRKSTFSLKYSDEDAVGYEKDYDSCYSYFQIPELDRVNYIYMNVDEIYKFNKSDSYYDWKVDDMFFTTERAAWID